MASAGCAKRKQCAGVPPPAWLDPAFLEIWAEGPTEWGPHVPPGAIDLFHLGGQIGSKFAFFRNLFAFFSHDASKLRFYRFPMVLKWILEGLGKVPGVFWRWFFTRFSKKSIFEKIAFPLEKIDKFKGFGL